MELGACGYPKDKTFLSNQVASVPNTPNLQGTKDIRDEVLLSVGAQVRDASGYQVSNLEDIEFHWKHPDLKMDALFQPKKIVLRSPSLFNNFQIRSKAENEITVDKEEDKENYLHHPPTTPVSEKPTNPPVLIKSRPF